MSIARHYALTPRDTPDDLIAALHDLSHHLQPCEGSLGTEILVGQADPVVVLFIERWRSEDDREAAGKQLGREIFAPVIARISGGPQINDYRVMPAAL